jgi:hypothetical protein
MLDRSLPSRRRNRAAEGRHFRNERIIAELLSRHGPVVQAGPFAGLRLPSREYRESLAPLLIGSYEEELHELIEKLLARSPRRVVNVGCADGYYAVGLARRLADADVYAFDIDERGQRLTRETAELNGVGGRVHVAAECTPQRLEQLLIAGTLVVMDCEGCELELLRPDRVPSLRQATILVELHDWVSSEISSEILARFEATHSARVVGVRRRAGRRYPALSGFSRSDRKFAVDEGRPRDPHPMEWAALHPLR